MIVSGLDPGKSGALVTLFEDGSTLVNRVPLMEGKLRPGKKSAAKIPDERQWSRDWRNQLLFSTPDVFVVEAVHGWKGQSAGASFSFGRSMGFAMATILYVDVPIHPAPPSVWKQRLGISQDKADAIAEALRLVPSLAPHLTRKMDDGVAEAGLLAYYGLMTIAAK
jgi:crossover junction endodeoxyribonuclease RuvC